MRTLTLAVTTSLLAAVVHGAESAAFLLDDFASASSLAALLALLVVVHRLRTAALRSRQQVLEAEVSRRTAELREANARLKWTSEIVTAINSELDFDRVLEMLLRIHPRVDVAMALVLDRQAGVFRVHAALGWDPTDLQDVALTRQQIDAHCAGGAEISPGLFVAREPLPGDMVREVVLLRIDVRETAEGFLLFECRLPAGSASDVELRLLSDLRQPVLSAFERARVLSDLARINDARNEFVAVASHDLQTPLGVVSGWLTMAADRLRAGTIDRSRAIEFIENAGRAADQMIKLVRDLVDISALDTGRMELVRARHDLAAIVNERVVAFTPLAAAKSIDLTAEMPGRPARAWLDHDRIVEVLDNLLSNALKYTHAGGRVRVSFSTDGTEVVTHVEDSGQGFSDEDLQHVFRTFKRLSARPTAGEASTGLGLAIVKRLVEIHGGRIWLESVKWKGSTFSFSLPAVGPSFRGEARDANAIERAASVR